eukprot:TRINITY_DN6072_c0_g1_i2.p1 TRINITY_DN6072_c0_g1~~TRINITY_DN6072_c0_g1_i2.p1  ORF type:complete len:836 (-),score=237.28 TRINITY_DN6072_c0_g1_i2:39-2546(-)
MSLLMGTCGDSKKVQNCFSVPIVQDVFSHLQEELYCDWKILQDITKESPDVIFGKLLQIMKDLLLVFRDFSAPSTLDSAAKRDKLEASFVQAFDSLWSKTKSSGITKNFVLEDEKSDPFHISHILCFSEALDPEEAKEFGKMWLPSRRDKSLLRFMKQVHQSDARNHSLLKFLIKNQIILRAIPHLPNAVKFANLVSELMSSKLSEEDVLKMNVRQVIERSKEEMIQAGSNEDLKALFKSFSEMWNLLFPVVQNYECQQLQTKFEMNLDAPGGLLLLTEANLGIYPRVYFSTAADCYNTFVDLASNNLSFDEKEIDIQQKAKVKWRPLEEQRPEIESVFPNLLERVYYAARWSYDEKNECFCPEDAEAFLRQQLAVLNPVVLSVRLFRFSEDFDRQVMTPIQDLNIRVTRITASQSFPRPKTKLSPRAIDLIRSSVGSLEVLYDRISTFRAFLNLLEPFDIAIFDSELFLVEVAAQVGLKDFGDKVGAEISRFCKLSHLPEVVKILSALQDQSSAAASGKTTLDVDEVFRNKFSADYLESKQVVPRLQKSLEDFKIDVEELRSILYFNVPPKISAQKDYFSQANLWEELNQNLLEENAARTSQAWFDHVAKEFPEFRGCHFAAFVEMLDQIISPSSHGDADGSFTEGLTFEELYGGADAKLSQDTSLRLARELQVMTKQFRWNLDHILRVLHSVQTRKALAKHAPSIFLSVWSLLGRIFVDDKEAGLSPESLEYASLQFPQIKALYLLEVERLMAECVKASQPVLVAQSVAPLNVEVQVVFPTAVVPTDPITQTENSLEDKKGDDAEAPSVSAGLLTGPKSTGRNMINKFKSKKK